MTVYTVGVSKKEKEMFAEIWMFKMHIYIVILSRNLFLGAHVKWICYPA